MKCEHGLFYKTYNGSFLCPHCLCYVIDEGCLDCECMEEEE